MEDLPHAVDDGQRSGMTGVAIENKIFTEKKFVSLLNITVHLMPAKGWFLSISSYLPFWK
jgi:hypothetical protein